MKHQILNNFIDPILYSSIKDTLTGDTFLWSYKDFINYKPSNEFYFTTEIMKDSNLLSNIFVNYLAMVKPVLDKIPNKEIKSLSFILLTKRPNTLQYPITRYKKNSKFLILFGNKSNGGISVDNEIITSKENTAISFNQENTFNFVFPTKDKITTFVLVNYL